MDEPSTGAGQSSAAAPPEELAGNLCWLLTRGSAAMSAEVAERLKAIGLSPRGHQVLATALTGEHTQIELARMVGLDKTTMVATLDDLEAAGLAQRRPSKRDRRARVIAVTRSGRRKVAQADAILDGIRRDWLSSLPAPQRESFLGALQRVVTPRL